MTQTINRKPVVAGRFYPESPSELKKMLGNLFFNVKSPDKHTRTRALIVPHAGYIFSGSVAAQAYARIPRERQIDTIFILAPSHYASFNAASIYNAGNYETPLGEIPVNLEIANALIQKNHLFSYNEEVHKYEHSVEVQLPFLKYWLKNNFKILPILIGTQNEQSLQQIANILSPYFTPNNLFIISSDFSHFPDFEGAIQADKNMEQAILSKQISEVDTAVQKNQDSNIKNLSTSACGLAGIRTLLHLMENQDEITISKIKYMNSGDTPNGNHKRVVGYMSFDIHEPIK